MRFGEPAVNRSKQIVWGIFLFLTLLFFLAFRRDILQFFGVSPVIRVDEPQNAVLSPLSFVFYICLSSFFLVFVLWMMMISFQALLPISNLLEQPGQCLIEVYRSCFHLLLYMFHLHGPAIFVKDGEANATSEDLQRENWPGVVVVDFNSAVVLEERNPPPGMEGAFVSILMLFLEALYLMDRKESPRVRGAGIIFTRPRERIHGTVDLRKQFRLLPKVQCYTREGIELAANIFSIFTIGQDPDVLQVTYTGDMRAENLSIVTLHVTPDGFILVKKFNEDPAELDSPDRQEIHAYAVKNRFPYNSIDLKPYSQLPRSPKQVQFNPDRVLNAVLAQAHNGSQETLTWTDLPTRVAAGMYREILSQVNYDDLYDIKGTGKFPLWDIKGKLKASMRNNGILAFRLVFTLNGKPLVKGHTYRPEELIVSPTIQLTNPKVLRDRGIKIILGNFGDPTPVNEAIYVQRLDRWRAECERNLDISLAARELETMRERSRAYSEAQRDMWFSFSQLFNNPQYNEEILTLRVLAAIEEAASNPKTRSLLPAHIIQLLSNIEQILIPTPNQPPANSLGMTDLPNLPNNKS